MSDITKLTVKELSEKLRARELSAADAASAYIENIKARDGGIRAYITVTEEKAIAAAREADRLLAAGDANPLTGVPMGIKDNICTLGTKTTCASKMLRDFIPPYDATVMEKLSGAVMLGKLNMDEFAMGSSTENSAFYPTRNPRDLTRVPGGSSGGAAAAVAAEEAAFSIGSDTGGSVRQPAAFCGVVGMKPTYGGVSRYGLIAFASSLDQIGPLTKDVYDSALVMNAIAGHDKRDSTSVSYGYEDFTEGIEKGVRGMKIALPMEFLGEGISPEVKAAILAAAEKYASLGAEIIQLSLPALEDALPAYYVISSAEASSNLARFDRIRYGYRTEDYSDIDELYRKSRSEGFGAEVKRRIMLGTFALSSGYYDAYYKRALQVRTLVTREFSRAFERCDVILSPVAPTTAYKIGEKTENPMEMYLGDIYTVPVNIAGIPALSMPCGADGEGLPVGMQLMGPHFGEKTLIRAGYAFEKEVR